MALFTLHADRPQLFSRGLHWRNKKRCIQRFFLWLEKARIVVDISNINSDAIAQYLTGGAATDIHIQERNCHFVLKRSGDGLRHQHFVVFVHQVDNSLICLRN